MKWRELRQAKLWNWLKTQSSKISTWLFKIPILLFALLVVEFLVKFRPWWVKLRNWLKTQSSKVSTWLFKIPTLQFLSAVALILIGLTLFLDDDVNWGSLKSIVKTVFDNLESISIVVGIALYLKEVPDRQQAKHYAAWQVIDNAVAVKTSYARNKALEDLHRDKVPLSGIDLPGTDLQGINLGRANLIEANLESADLENANFNSADLSFADLSSANLSFADLSFADLSSANLSFADLSSAILDSADISFADLSSANLASANLASAILASANLASAILSFADLSFADLSSANLSRTILLSTNLSTARNLARDQLIGESAPFLCNTQLPEEFSDIDSDRDCDKLPQILVDQEWFESLEKAEAYVEEQRQ